MTQMVKVPFHGDFLHAIERDGQVWFPLAPACEALGLHAQGQQQRVARAAWAAEGTCVTHVPSSGGTQQMFAVSLDIVPMWLATISSGRVKPEARARLVQYQREAARVLRDHFFGAPQPAAARPLMGESHKAVSSQIRDLVFEVVSTRTGTRSRQWFYEHFMELGFSFSIEHVAYVLRNMLDEGVLMADKHGWGSAPAGGA